MSFRALILAGGAGTRFWPASRRLRPKQLLALEGERSLLQTTVDRLRPIVPPSAVWISTTEALAPAIREQLPEVPAAQVLAEPAGRNTAPAIGWSLLAMPEEARRGVVAVLPADHRVADGEAFRTSLAAAVEVAANADRVVALGVRPTYPESGFGYLELGPSPPDAAGPARVTRFTEKPDRATAARFLASGRYLWNAGIFVFRGDVLWRALERHAPELAAGMVAAAADPFRAAERYAALPAISIDYAVMEKLDDIVALPLDCGWNDLGSWSALGDVLAADARGNIARGDVVTVDSTSNVVVAEQGLVALLGVEGLVVVASGDAVLVARRDAVQDVRKIVERLVETGRRDLL
ncbi:MAG: sugar phosphate nucleotidyltransferase [Thermoanaerobaculia bacterium]